MRARRARLTLQHGFPWREYEGRIVPAGVTVQHQAGRRIAVDCCLAVKGTIQCVPQAFTAVVSRIVKAQRFPWQTSDIGAAACGQIAFTVIVRIRARQLTGTRGGLQRVAHQGCTGFAQHLRVIGRPKDVDRFAVQSFQQRIAGGQQIMRQHDQQRGATLLLA